MSAKVGSLAPLDDLPSLLMQYQVEAIQLSAENQLFVSEKSRRTGLTYAFAADAVLTAAPAQGGQDFFYIAYNKDMTIREIVADPAFDQFAALPDQPFPIAALTADQAAAVGATARTVRFSPQTLEKQKRRHAELTIADYRLLPEIISNPAHALREDDRRVRLLWESDGQWWRATIKSTEQGDELYVLSMHRLRIDDVSSLVSRFAAILEWFGAR